MKVRFILSFLAALFIAGNMIAIESTERVERKLPLVLKGEVPTTTSRSIPEYLLVRLFLQMIIL